MAPPEGPPGAHPEPPPDLAARGLPVTTSRGPWCRSHLFAHDALWFGRTGRNRFDSPSSAFGVCYLAVDPYGAFIETFGHATGAAAFVTRKALQRRALSRVDASRSLRLVDLTGNGLAVLGADGRLTTGEIAVAQRWAEALHDHSETPDGILYRARHDPSRLAVAVFERARETLSARFLGTFASRRLGPYVGQLLDQYGFGLVEGG